MGGSFPLLSSLHSLRELAVGHGFILTLIGDNIFNLLLPGHGWAQIPQLAYQGELPAYPKVTKLSVRALEHAR